MRLPGCLTEGRGLSRLVCLTLTPPAPALPPPPFFQSHHSPASLGRLRELAGRLARAPAFDPAAIAAEAAEAAAGSNRLMQDGCETCKTIVVEAAVILADPKTQIELLDYARQGCEVFQVGVGWVGGALGG